MWWKDYFHYLSFDQMLWGSRTANTIKHLFFIFGQNGVIFPPQLQVFKYLISLFHYSGNFFWESLYPEGSNKIFVKKILGVQDL